MAMSSAPIPVPVRGRTSALNLDELFLFMTAASAALPGAAAVRQVASPEPTAAVAPAQDRPLVAPPEAHARFAALLATYDRLIQGIVSRVGRSLGLTRDSFLVREDVAQEVRLELWKQVARGQTIEFPATYIYKATIRETLRAVRRQNNRDTVSIEGDGGADHVVDAVDPFHALAAKEQFREIILAIRCLTPDRQSAVRAHLVGFAFNEIMSQFGWSYQRTRNLIARGMADLRKSLNDKGEAPAEAHRAFDLVAQANRTAEALRRTARVLGRTVPA